MKVAGTRETSMDKLGSPDQDDYGEVRRLGDLFFEVFDQNHLAGLSDHNKRPLASEANKRIARERKERETRVVITVILNAGTLCSSLDGRPFPTCLPDNYAVFPPDAHSCKKYHASVVCDSVLSVHIPKPEDSDIMEVAAIPPRTSFSASDKTTARSATITATTTAKTTPPESSITCGFEEEEDLDAPPFDCVSGADEDEDDEDYAGNDTDSDIIEIPSEEEKTPLPVAWMETSPSELQVTFGIGTVPEGRVVQRTPLGELTKGVSGLQVRSPEPINQMMPMTAKERAKANVRAAKATGAILKKSEEVKPRPIPQTNTPPSLEHDETSSAGADAHELARRTYQSIAMQIQTARPLQVSGVGRGQALKNCYGSYEDSKVVNLTSYQCSPASPKTEISRNF